MLTTKGNNAEHTQGNQNTQVEVEKAHNKSHGLAELTANFAALVVKEVENKTATSAKPTSKRQYASTSSHEYSNVFEEDDDHTQQQAFMIGQSVFTQLLSLLPSIIDERIRDCSSLETTSFTNEVLQNDIGKLQKKQTDMLNKIEGQQKKITAWTERIKKLENFQKKSRRATNK